MLMHSRIAIGAALLTVSLAFMAAVATSAPTKSTPGVERSNVTIQLNMTGQAIRTNGGPDDTFTFYVNASGDGVRSTPRGNGVQVRAQGMEAQIVVVDAEGTEVENYTAFLQFHAQQASYLGQGLDGFRFSMQLAGSRSTNVGENRANPDGRVLAFNAHGGTLGAADEDGVFALEGRGQTTTKEGTDNNATHFNLLVGGTGSITSN